MRKLYLTLIPIIYIWPDLFSTGDSLHYLTPKDTVFLKLDDFGNKIFEHQIEKGQTIFSLARFYGLKLDALYAYNPSLLPGSTVPPGQIINIPVPDTAIVKDWPAKSSINDFVPVFYKVRQGDTFYSICRSYFKIPIDTLLKRNNLSSTLMYSGQELMVGWLSMNGIPDSLQLINTNPMGARMQMLQMAFENGKTTKKLQFQNGAAYWQREKKGNSDFYALHRQAPVGSVIEVRNPMKKKVVYAKVLGTVPDRAYGNDTIVVLSPSVAKLLGAKDPRFFVEIRYFK